MNAHCNTSFVNDACLGGHGGGGWPFGNSRWFEYILKLGCFMDGTWYSTQGAGMCKDNDPREACWWRLVETKRTVNQTCVDKAVVNAVKKRRPSCWEACPGTTGTNITQPCYLDCLFTTILGNATQHVAPMKAAEVAAAFTSAFAPEEQGGCPTVKPKDARVVEGHAGLAADWQPVPR